MQKSRKDIAAFCFSDEIMPTVIMVNQKFMELRHTMEHGSVTNIGVPAPIVCDYMSREDSRKLYETIITFFNL